MKKQIIIETIKASKKEKREYVSTPVRSESILDGDIRVIVLRDYKGMLDNLYVGDIIDVPERRYKSLAFRGLVEKYGGKKQPNKKR